LDSALIVHITNNHSWFIDFKESDSSKFIFTRDTRVLIEGTGTIIIKGQALDGEELVLTLTNTLYALTFHTNIVSLTQAIAWGVY
jgi:hypothetical protein